MEIHFVFYSVLSLPLISGWKGATSDRTAWNPATSGMTCLIVDVETGWRLWSREPGSSTRGVWHTPWLGPQITLRRKCSSEKVCASGHRQLPNWQPSWLQTCGARWPLSLSSSSFPRLNVLIVFFVLVEAREEIISLTGLQHVSHLFCSCCGFWGERGHTPLDLPH